MQSTTTKSSITNLFSEIVLSGQITPAAHSQIMAALLEEKLNDEEKASIKRLLYALRRGRLQIVEETHTAA